MPNLPITYPPARREDLVENLHGTPVPDPYRWLEDDHSDETTAWVRAQNDLTFSLLEQIPAREEIRQRMTELWDYEKFSPPFKRGGRYFYTRNDGLQNQAVLVWQSSLEGDPRLLLDPNTLSADGTVALAAYAVSDDGQYLAYSLNSAGSDWQEWRVRLVDTGEDLPDLIRWSKFSGAAWTTDNAGFYYSRYDTPTEGEAYKGANYYQKLYYHRLGTSQDADTLAYERPDQKEWGFGGEVSHDGRYLIISVWHGTFQENAIFYQDLQQPGAPVIELFNQFDAAYTYFGSQGSRLYFLTNHAAPLYRVIAVDVDNPAPEHWQEIIPAAEDTLISASIVGDQIFAISLHHAHSLVRVFDLEGQLIRTLELPGLGTVVGFEGTRQDSETFYLYTSFTTPGVIYRYDLTSGESYVFRQPALRFDPSQYITEQVFYPSRDGTRVPMFISYKQGMERNGQNPTYLYGYGGFNIAVTPAFSPANLVWMERGGVFALANLRGGGEYGKPWHDAGKQRSKQNVFDDFITAGEWLIEQGYTTSARLGIHGRSNGGLLTGACLTQRPDLFGAAIVTVGVLDMLRYHKFTIGWAWVSDYGSPDDPDDFRYLLTYSPYHNVRPGVSYPPTLVTTGDHDDRVFPAHSFKFAAALQAHQSGPDPVLIRIDVRAGHGQGKPTAKLIAEATDILAFLTHHLHPAA
jgi:prolyl oligopeptidase